MKKRAVILYILFCIIILISSCKETQEQSYEPDVSGEIDLSQDMYTLTFIRAPGIKYICDNRTATKVKSGTYIDFGIEISSFYEGNPEVKINNIAIDPDENGHYGFTVERNTSVTVNGLTVKESSITGTGTDYDDPYIITQPIDLIYMADRINAGDAEYISAYYALDNDIDFNGEEIEIIGDASSDYSYFEGYFDGRGHTISNFTINSYDRTYVGLFGIIQASLTNSMGGTVYDLHLDNFSVNASNPGGSVFCGSLAGYAIGSNIILCSAEGGSVNIYADTNNFSYVGALVGFLQSMDYNGYTYLSSTVYCNTDVDVECLEGMVYSAGGIAGYLTASDSLTPASVINCYSDGNVYGALISGGIAGYMSEATCIGNCYSTGNIGAQSSVSDSDNNSNFCHSYAGGIAGLARPDSIISESFATGKIYSKSQLGSSYQHAGEILGLASEPDDGAYADSAATVYNCLYAENGKNGEIDLTDSTFIRESLNWNDCDWVFGTSKYPVFNTEESDFVFDITIKMSGEEDLSVTEFDAYMPMSFWYLEDILPSSLTGGGKGTITTYGYYFDPEFTLPVPESYVPTHALTLYAAAADYSEVAGKYIILLPDGNDPCYIKLYNDGTFSYTDGGGELYSLFKYDGEKIVLRNARLARYSEELTGMEKYDFSDYICRNDNGTLTITGGIFTDNTAVYTAFTESNPLIAISDKKALAGSYSGGSNVYTFYPSGNGFRADGTYTYDFTYTKNGSEIKINYASGSAIGNASGDKISIGGIFLARCDSFTGSWSVDSKANKIFTFDGAGNWIYEYFVYDTSDLSGAKKVTLESKSGKYISAGNNLSLTGDITGKASFVSEALVITVPEGEYTLHRAGSYTGTWVYPEYNITLTLNGIGINGSGSAKIEYLYPDDTVEFYELTYSSDNLNNGTIDLFYEEDVFGYMYYSPENDAMNSLIYVGPLGTFMNNVPLYRIDDIKGEWISDSDIPIIEFNGLGGYGEKDFSGIITVNGQSLNYTLEEGTLSGAFVYNEKAYIISYSEAGELLTLSSGGKNTVFSRKDIFGGMQLKDRFGNIYLFDGRGRLASKGIMTVIANDGSEKEYVYSVTGENANIYSGSTVIGSLKADKASNSYVLSVNGSSTLKIVTDYSKTWAMSGSLENMYIGEMGLDGSLEGRINGVDTVFTMKDNYLEFEFNGTLFYVIPSGKSNLVISQTIAWYTDNDIIYCAPVDDIFGTWTNSLGASYSFDGMSNSALTTATAQSSLDTEAISYFYRCDGNGVYIIWGENNGQSVIFRATMCDTGTRRAFIQDDRAFTVEEGDKLFEAVFHDNETETDYTFDGFGKVTDSEGRVFDYKLISLDESNGTGAVVITIDGEDRSAALDFSGTEFIISFS